MAVEAENLTFDDLKQITEGLSMRQTSPMVTPDLPRGSFDWLSFPREDLDTSANPTVHIFDVVTGYQSAIDFHELGRLYKEAIEKKDLQLLPPPFGLKAQVPSNVQLQMVLLKDADGHQAILKHLAFPDKVKPSFLKGVVFGTPQRAKWMSGNPKVGRKVLQYCLEGLGGRQFKCFELSSQVTNKKIGKAIPFEDKEDEEIDAGFDYILKHGPRSSSEMAQLRWQTKAIRKENSPICGWPTGLVEKALRNLASDGALARKEFSWPIPLTLRYYAPWLLKCLEGLWDFDQSSLVMLGEAGVGKSPLGRSVLMAQVRYNKAHFNLEGEPCIRCTPEIDFLRGEAGSILMGDFLDDTSLSLLSVKMVKAFLDVGLYESMCWARWGATKWVQNEPRTVADNTYDDGVKLPPSFVPQVSFETFYNMIRPAFTDQASKAHMDAIFKRTAFLVNSKEHLYFRPAGINTDPVQRISMPICEYLTEEGKKVYGAFKAGAKEMPEHFEEEVLKEQEWVTTIMNNLYQKRRANKQQDQMRCQIRQAFFGEQPRNEESITERMEAREVTIKREQEEADKTHVFKKARVWSQELKASRSVIDLDSPQERSSASAGQEVEEEEYPDVFQHGNGMSASE